MLRNHPNIATKLIAVQYDEGNVSRLDETRSLFVFESSFIGNRSIILSSREGARDESIIHTFLLGWLGQRRG